MTDQRVVLITGCSRGIGLATAVAFAERGDVVVATLRDPVGGAQPLRDALLAAGSNTEVMALDVTEDASVDRVVDTMLSRHGRIDVLVNNAGVGYRGTLEELSIDDFQA